MKLFRDPTVLVGSLVIAAMVFLAIFAPWVAPYDPVKPDMKARLKAPSAAHPLGTDQLGRDILSRVIWGARVSILVGLVAVGIGFVSGTILGLISGYYGGVVDIVIMRFADTLLSFPLVLMAILLIAFFGSSLLNIMVAVGISMAPKFARVARASTLAAREKEYVESARALGASDLIICLRHILPNILSSLMIVATLYVAAAILIESNLSYLGLGVKPPTPTWGSIINDGRKVLREAPWISLFSGAAIMLTVLAFNMVGDALRDHFDPRLKED